ncbi:MAG TPA: hypothetical protein VME47_05000 [Acetobacteraceae bacterium]|nr:hypothetical protein [Acetobacteraceae bacterium]
MQELTTQDQRGSGNIAEERRFYHALTRMYHAFLETNPIYEREKRRLLKDRIKLIERKGLGMVHEHIRAEERSNSF